MVYYLLPEWVYFLITHNTLLLTVNLGIYIRLLFGLFCGKKRFGFGHLQEGIRFSPKTAKPYPRLMVW